MNVRHSAIEVQIAEICHEANRAYCRTIGDDSQPPWAEAPDWQKLSAMNGVAFHLSTPDAQPCDSHNAWKAEKARAGWKYGPVKDAAKKEHPCFVPYDELPPEQKVKDTLFMAIVHALRPAAVPKPQVIQPTIGRIVLYSPLPGVEIQGDENGQCPAIITRVWDERMVNLTVFDANGLSFPVTSVPLVQPQDPNSQSHGYCEWMPYQIKKPTGSESGEPAAGQQSI